jgi:choline monooxygenase
MQSNIFTQAETYSQSRLPVDQASTLIPAAYTTPEFFAIEQEKVFSNGWGQVVYLKSATQETSW